MKKNIAKVLIITMFLAVLPACNSQPQQSAEGMAIEAVYSLDQKISSNSKTVSESISKMQSIVLTGCPPDFVDAYRAYVKSWTKLADIEQKMYTANMQKATGDIENFLSEYQSNPTKATVELKTGWPSFAKQIDVAVADIAKAYVEFTAVGLKYNAVYKTPSLLF